MTRPNGTQQLSVGGSVAPGECACCQPEPGDLQSVHPKLAARSPVHRAVRAAQEKDIQWFMARPTVRERTRPATLAEQRLCWNLYGMPVTEIRVWLERVKVKYEGWSDTFRWTAR